MSGIPEIDEYEQEELKQLDEEFEAFLCSPSSDEDLVSILQGIEAYSYKYYYAYAMVHGGFSFVTNLKRYLESNTEVSPRVGSFMEIIGRFLARWSLLRPNGKYLGSAELGLVPLTLKNIEVFPDAREDTYEFLLNCLAEPSTHSYLLSEEVGLLKRFHDLMIEHPEERIAYWGISNIALNCTPFSLQRIIDENIPVLMWQRLLHEGPETYEWIYDVGPAARCLVAFVYMSGYEKGNKALIDDAKIDIAFFRQIIFYALTEGIPARIICLNYYYYNYPHYYSSSLSLETIQGILDLMRAVLADILPVGYNEDDNKATINYRRYKEDVRLCAPIRLDIVTATLLNLSHLDVIYQQMITSYQIFFDYFFFLCSEFIENKSIEEHDVRQYSVCAANEIGSIERMLQFFIIFGMRSIRKGIDWKETREASVQGEEKEENPLEAIFVSDLLCSIIDEPEEDPEGKDVTSEGFVALKGEEELWNQILTISRKIRLIPEKDGREINATILEYCERLENLGMK